MRNRFPLVRAADEQPSSAGKRHQTLGKADLADLPHGVRRIDAQERLRQAPDHGTGIATRLAVETAEL